MACRWFPGRMPRRLSCLIFSRIIQQRPMEWGFGIMGLCVRVCEYVACPVKEVLQCTHICIHVPHPFTVTIYCSSSSLPCSLLPNTHKYPPGSCIFPPTSTHLFFFLVVHSNFFANPFSSSHNKKSFPLLLVFRASFPKLVLLRTVIATSCSSCPLITLFI